MADGCDPDKTWPLFIQPNPLSSTDPFLRLQLARGVIDHLYVFDISGRIVLSRTAKTDPVVLDLYGMTPGSYIVRVIDASGVPTQRRFLIE